MGSRFLAAAAAMQVAHDKGANLEKYQHFVESAAAADVRLLVLPEVSLQGFLFAFDHGFDPEESTYHLENAEAVPNGDSTQSIMALAKQHNMFINFGMFERVEYAATPILYNTSVLVGPEGYIGSYRKIHRPIEEQLYYHPGSAWSVCATDVGSIGLMICYDQTFPEAARELTLRGAEVLTVPSAWAIIDEASRERYELFGRVRALENNRWLIQSNQVGKSDKGNIQYLGYSRIINPDGVVVACTLDGEEGLAIAEIDPQKRDPARGHTRWYVQQRVPDVYTRITDPNPWDSPNE